MALKTFWHGIKHGFSEVGHDITNAVNTLLLTIAYIGGAGITKIAAVIVGKKFLELKLNPSQESYYVELNLGKESKERYYRQF